MGNIQIGGTLYIKSKDCKLLKRPNGKDPSYGFMMLQPGTAIKWLGQAPEDRAFHKIQVNGQIAYLLGQNLSTRPFAEPDLFGCVICKGMGKVETRWGNSVGLIDCNLCKGTGGRRNTMSSQAFPSHAAGTKG